MKKHWLAVIKGDSWIVAKVAADKKQKKIKVLSLARYEFKQSEGVNSEKNYHNILKLKEWLSRKKIPLKKLKITLSCPGVITRIVTLPHLSEKDLEKLLTSQIDQYFTFNTDDYIFDYRILRSFEENGQRRLSVLLAAVPKNQMIKLWSVCEQLGFKPKVVDLSSDCLARLYSCLLMDTAEADSKGEGEPLLGDIAVVDLNRDRAEFLILKNGNFFLYSDIKVQLEALDRQAYSSEQLKTEHLAASIGCPQFNKADTLPDEVNGFNRNISDEYSGNRGLPETEIKESVQAVLNNDENKNDFQREFVLEDLFFPLEQLNDNNSDITLKNSLQQKDSGIMEDLLEDSDLSVEDSIFTEDEASLKNEETRVGDESIIQDKISIEDKTIREDRTLIFDDINDLDQIFDPLGEKTDDLLQEKTQDAQMIESEPIVSNFLKETEAVTFPASSGLSFRKGERTTIKDDLENALTPVVGTLLELLGFFAARHFGQTVSTVYITGDFANLPFLAEIFEENLGIRTVVGFPQNWKPKFSRKSAETAAEWMKFGILYGLALRED